MGGCSASKPKEAGVVELDKELKTIEFGKTELGPIDDVFDKGMVVVNDFLTMNKSILENVTGIVKNQHLANSATVEDGKGGRRMATEVEAASSMSTAETLKQRLLDAVLGSYAAIEDSMPDNLEQIRAKAQEKPQEALTMAVKELPKLKALLPKVDLQQMAQGKVDISFPEGFKMDKLSGPAKEALEMVISFFNFIKEFCTTAITSVKTKMDAVTAEIKAINATSIKEAAVKATDGLSFADKAKFLKAKMDTVKQNVKNSAGFEDIFKTIIEKVQMIGQILMNAFKEAMTSLLQYAPPSIKDKVMAPVILGTGSEADVDAKDANKAPETSEKDADKAPEPLEKDANKAAEPSELKVDAAGDAPAGAAAAGDAVTGDAAAGDAAVDAAGDASLKEN